MRCRVSINPKENVMNIKKSRRQMVAQASLFMFFCTLALRNDKGSSYEAGKCRLCCSVRLQAVRHSSFMEIKQIAECFNIQLGNTQKSCRNHIKKY